MESNWENRITWAEELSTGNEKIDEHHKTIFNITDVFIETYLKGEGDIVLKEMLDFLISYTVEHFDYEEKLMIEYNYPEYVNHKKSHENFKIKVLEYKKEYENQGASDELNKNLSTDIIRWLIQHIKHEDFKISKFIRKQKQEMKG